jgi:hypothetical protein
MNRISSKLIVAACLWLSVSGASALTAQAAPEVGAIVDPSDIFLTQEVERECPTPSAPYGITFECARALSAQATRAQALRDFERAGAA